ncbi:MAG: hypothetical protein ACLRS2_20935 [[Clostridium] innocuum]
MTGQIIRSSPYRRYDRYNGPDLYLLFYPIAIVEEVNPFQTFKKVKFGFLFILLAPELRWGLPVSGIERSYDQRYIAECHE